MLFTKPLQTYTTTDDKKLSTCYSEKKCLKPMSSNQKYQNAALFEARETKFRNKNNEQESFKNSILRRRQKSSRHLRSANSNFYLTEDPYATNNTISTESDHKRTHSFNTTNAISPNVPRDYLSKIEEERRLLKEKKEKKGVIRDLDKKAQALHTGRHDSVRDYLNKTKDIVLLKLFTNIKKERVIRIQETYDNEIEKANETIAVMENAKSLFENQFVSTFSDYVKLLDTQKEQERAKDSLLIDKIIQLKHDIQALEVRKKRQGREKVSLSRWIYLQIQIKEKRLELPLYYKSVIEEIQQVPKYITKMTYKPMIKEKAVQQAAQSELANSIGDIEKERVLQYKKKLVFDSPDELLNEVKRFETKNVKLIKKYNKRACQLDILRKEYYLMTKDYFKDNEVIQQEIQLKENELSKVKETHEGLEREKKSVVEKKASSQKPKSKRAMSYDAHSPFKHKPFISIHCKVKKMYDEISALASIEEDKRPSYQKKLFPKNGNEVIEMLVFIERSVIHLLERYHKQMEGPLAMKVIGIQNGIEKRHKCEKTIQQKEAEANKIEKLKQKIEERSKKVYFLQRKKVDLALYNKDRKIKQDTIERQKEKANFVFEDLMHDLFFNEK